MFNFNLDLMIIAILASYVLGFLLGRYTEKQHSKRIIAMLGEVSAMMVVASLGGEAKEVVNAINKVTSKKSKGVTKRK